MVNRDVANISQTDMTNLVPDFSVDPVDTDGPTDQKETTYTNDNWSQQFGYYRSIPELKSVIDAKATWTVGKGFKANPITEMTLDKIKGYGNDTFNVILENMIRTMQIGGDAFAEIIRDKNNILINLKPLDPSTITIVVNRAGIIIRYEQNSKVQSGLKKFDPEKIFHLSRNRVADEIHGQSMIDPLVNIIDARNEAIADWRITLHRNVWPVRFIEYDGDDETEIANIKAEYATAIKNGEVMVIPKGTLKMVTEGLSSNATLSALPTIESYNDYFYEAANMPKIIIGGAGALTEKATSVAYVAWQQTVEADQLYIEEQCLSQLNLEIELEFPASLENELLSDKQKDGPLNIDPSETTEEVNPVG